jgi:hypothetical protein
LDNGKPVIEAIPLLSDAFRMSIDKLCYMSVFGSKSTFKSKVPAHVRAEFNAYVTVIHKDALQQTAWKKWLVDNPRTEGKDEEAGAAAQNPSGAAVQNPSGSVFNVGILEDEA